MTIHVRLRESWMTHQAGEDLALDGETAKFLQSSGKAWVTGGDAQEMNQLEVACDSDVGEPLIRPKQDTLVAEVTRNT